MVANLQICVVQSHGDGDQNQAGAVRRFCRGMELFFDLSGVPVDERSMQARLYLEGTAADCIYTVVQSLPASDCTSWSKFVELLGARFGNINPDAEFWDQLHGMSQGSSTAAEYQHKVTCCFNGITVLPLLEGDKIERCLHGLNPGLKRADCSCWLGCRWQMDKPSEANGLYCDAIAGLSQWRCCHCW